MFDKLIESDTKGAEFKGRSRYFMVSSVVVGILFVTAVVFSIYAADIGLGNEEFELSMMIAPVTPTAPEPPKQAQPEERRQVTNSQPTRVQSIMRPDEVPATPPTGISVNRSAFMSRPPGAYRIDKFDSMGTGDPTETSRPGGTPGGSSSATSDPVALTENIPDQPPPPIKSKPPAKTMVSEGVINGKATYLPVPVYPAPAKMINADGAVNVQVVIDESGKVISAKAINGHPLLRPTAEKAAWAAKFSPTYLSKVAVKVTGVIVYNFKRS